MAFKVKPPNMFAHLSPKVLSLWARQNCLLTLAPKSLQKSVLITSHPGIHERTVTKDLQAVPAGQGLLWQATSGSTARLQQTVSRGESSIFHSRLTYTSNWKYAYASFSTWLMGASHDLERTAYQRRRTQCEVRHSKWNLRQI
jgi:hypothetical protein